MPVVCPCSCCHEDVPEQAGAPSCISYSRKAQITAQCCWQCLALQRHWSSCSHALRGGMGWFTAWAGLGAGCRVGSREEGAATPHWGREMFQSGLQVLEVFPNLNDSLYLCSQAHTMRHLNTTHTCTATSTQARKLWKLGATLPHGLKATGASQASRSNSKLGLTLFQRAPHTLSENRYARDIHLNEERGCGSFRFKWRIVSCVIIIAFAGSKCFSQVHAPLIKRAVSPSTLHSLI